LKDLTKKHRLNESTRGFVNLKEDYCRQQSGMVRAGQGVSAGWKKVSGQGVVQGRPIGNFPQTAAGQAKNTQTKKSLSTTHGCERGVVAGKSPLSKKKMAGPKACPAVGPTCIGKKRPKRVCTKVRPGEKPLVGGKGGTQMKRGFENPPSRETPGGARESCTCFGGFVRKRKRECPNGPSTGN